MKRGGPYDECKNEDIWGIRRRAGSGGGGGGAGVLSNGDFHPSVL